MSTEQDTQEKVKSFREKYVTHSHRVFCAIDASDSIELNLTKASLHLDKVEPPKLRIIAYKDVPKEEIEVSNDIAVQIYVKPEEIQPLIDALTEYKQELAILNTQFLINPTADGGYNDK